MTRNLCDESSFGCRRRRARDERVLKSIPSVDTPLSKRTAVDIQFKTIRTLASGLNDYVRIGRVIRTRVRPVESIDGGRQRQVVSDLPFHTGLIVRELFRLHLLCDRRQLAELIA